MKTLVLTNDFPPRAGGIETFVHELLRRQNPETIAVLACAGATRSDGASAAEVRAYDAASAFQIARLRTGMWPQARVADAAVATARELGCDRVWLPSSAPHGLIVPMLHRRGLPVAVATTHGAEAGMAPYWPGQMILRAAAHAEVLTYLGSWTRSQIERALPRTQSRPEHRWSRLAPGVDVDVWQRSPELMVRVAQLREELGLRDRPVVTCVSRLVARKGQDRLIAAWPQVLRRHPDAVLLIVGTGPRDKALRSQAASLPGSVAFTGRVPYADLPAYTALADIATLPARARLGGVDVEGLGIVLLEAAALGLPTIACDTGGVPDALIADKTGLLLPNSRDEKSEVAALAEAVNALLADAGLRQRFGDAGRAWVEGTWTWDVPAEQLAQLLATAV